MEGSTREMGKSVRFISFLTNSGNAGGRGVSASLKNSRSQRPFEPKQIADENDFLHVGYKNV